MNDELLPWFQFHHAKWRVEIGGLTREEKGAVLEIITSGTMRLQSKDGIPPSVAGMLRQDEEGWYLPALENAIIDAEQSHFKHVNAGKSGGKGRPKGKNRYANIPKYVRYPNIREDKKREDVDVEEIEKREGTDPSRPCEAPPNPNGNGTPPPRPAVEARLHPGTMDLLGRMSGNWEDLMGGPFAPKPGDLELLSGRLSAGYGEDPLIRSWKAFLDEQTKRKKPSTFPIRDWIPMLGKWLTEKQRREHETYGSEGPLTYPKGYAYAEMQLEKKYKEEQDAKQAGG